MKCIKTSLQAMLKVLLGSLPQVSQTSQLLLLRLRECVITISGSNCRHGGRVHFFQDIKALRSLIEPISRSH